MQMELEGTGVRASIVRPGPTGARWAPPGTTRTRPTCSTSGCGSGSPGTRTSSSPTALANAIHTIVSAPRGVHLNLIEVTPEAPVEDR